MEYTFRNCTLEDFDFLFELKNKTLNGMLIKYGNGEKMSKKKD